MKFSPIEEILLESKVVDQAYIDKANVIRKEKGGQIKDILIQMGSVTELDMMQALSRGWDIEFVPVIGETDVDPAILDKIPITFLRRYNIVPIKWQGDTMALAVNDPMEQDPVFDISRRLHIQNIKRVLATKKEILACIGRLNDMKDESAKDIMDDLEEEDEILKDLESIPDITVVETEAPIIRLVNRIMVQAFRERASDIHVEPYQSDVKVRFRVDGILHDVLTVPKRIQSAVISRIKVMASMDIAEKRLPQDGRIGIKLGDHSVDLRISTVPTVFGERVVMRILDKSSVLMGLEDLGFYPDDLSIISQLIKQEHGIILVTGPTGGEIRDLETAEIAIHAALTGHLVFSTLHTNDSASAITRLIDMGIEPFLVSSSVNAIIAQRLVRKICLKCKREYYPEAETLSEIGLSKELLDKVGYLYRGIGCKECLETGYKGRTGIYEILMMSDSIRAALLKTSDSNLIKRQAIDEGLHALREDGTRKVKDGITVVEEVLRVTQ